MDKNREFAELVGQCWNPNIDKDKGLITPLCSTCCRFHANPDYATDPRLVLREIKRLGKLNEFLFHIYKVIDLTNYPEDLETLVDLILDITGKLRDEAIEFLKKEGFGKQYKITGPCEGDCEQRKEA